MTGYIILGAFILYVVSVFVAFLVGYSKGRRKEQNEQKDEMIRKAVSDREFEKTKEEIRGEVSQNAEQKKAELSNGAGRDNFDAINNSLRDN